MFYTVSFLVFVLFLLAAWLVYYTLFPVYSSKQSKLVTDNLSQLANSGKAVEAFISKVDKDKKWSKIFSKFPLTPLTKNNVAEMDYLIKRLGLQKYDITIPIETLHMRQVSTLLVYMAVVITLTFVNRGAVALMLAYYFVYSLPILKLRKKVDKENEEIIDEFEDLFAMFFYAFKEDSVNQPSLSDIAENYMPFASPATATMLRRMKEYSEHGERYALQRIRTEYPTKNIIRFTTDLITRLEGIDNTYNLIEFKRQLDQEESIKLRKRQEKRYKITDVLGYVIIVIFFVAVIIHFWGQRLMIGG